MGAAAPDIKALRDRFGVDSIPEIIVPANRDLTGVAARLTMSERIRRMRQWGLPEAMILDDVFEQERQEIRSRGGPRTEDEALVFAARILLPGRGGSRRAWLVDSTRRPRHATGQ